MVRRADILAAALVLGLGGCLLQRGTVSGPQARASDDNAQGAFEYARGELSAAERWFSSGLEHSQSIDDAAGQATALLNLSRVDAQRWNFGRANRRTDEALRLAQDDPRLRGAALARRAQIRSQRGEHDGAIADARDARQLVDALELKRRDRRRLEGDRITTLAYTLVRAGGEHCAEAQAVLSSVGDVYGRSLDTAAEAAVASLRGHLALGRGNGSDAESWLARALELDRERGRPLDVAGDLEALAAAAELRGDRDRAVSWLERALAVRETVDTPRQALAAGQRLVRLVGSDAQLEGRLALLRTEVGDAPGEPPVAANACR